MPAFGSVVLMPAFGSVVLMPALLLPLNGSFFARASTPARCGACEFAKLSGTMQLLNQRGRP
jgi:hypothetical protein